MKNLRHHDDVFSLLKLTSMGFMGFTIESACLGLIVGLLVVVLFTEEQSSFTTHKLQNATIYIAFPANAKFSTDLAQCTNVSCAGAQDGHRKCRKCDLHSQYSTVMVTGVLPYLSVRFLPFSEKDTLLGVTNLLAGTYVTHVLCAKPVGSSGYCQMSPWPVELGGETVSLQMLLGYEQRAVYVPAAQNSLIVALAVMFLGEVYDQLNDD